MRRLVIGAFIVFASLVTPLSQAQAPRVGDSSVLDTHVVKIPVANQSADEQRRAVRKAFRQAILKMSGNRAQFNRSLWRSFETQATVFLKAYQYEVVNNELFIVATFDKLRMQTLLRENQLKIWSERRPDSIVWLTLFEPNAADNIVVSETLPNEFNQIVLRVAEERGIPITLPIFDIEDANTVSVYDIWGRFTRPVEAANQRYGINHAVIARVRKTPNYDPDVLKERIEAIKANASEEDFAAIDELLSENLSALPVGNDEPVITTGGDNAFDSDVGEAQVAESFSINEDDDVLGEPDELEAPPLFSYEEFQTLLSDLQPFQLDFTFIIDGQVISGNVGAEQPHELVEELVNRYADTLAERYAIDAIQSDEDLTRVTIKVNNIQNLTDYQQVYSLLSTMSVVKQASLLAFIGQEATFELRLFADTTQLVDALVLDGRLKPKVDAFGNVVDIQELTWSQQ
ncbi:DUF2066 domain-containing protein [Alteromonas facilis]|uniref:DUF2066 domain-containing protein n=1 Tax=Alteromonas facilis TaxID=2048004 RepID=UPI000C28BF64|nr:DUF2066 domain-containing protein [Alteromonas facilis]